nr:E3 ubiquitin-protein ligase LUL4 [Ipomoea batatas]
METAGGGVSRRRMLTADRKFDSPNLRDFLRVKEVSNSNGGSDNMAGLTLGDVLCREPRSTTAELPHRTLLDIIRDEPFQIDNRTTDVSRSARFSAANTVSEAEPPSVRLIQPELTASSEPPRRESDSATLIVLLQRSSSRAVDRGTSRFDEAEANGESREASGGGELEPEARVDQPARLSLMALLAETDREMGIDGAAYVLDTRVRHLYPVDTHSAGCARGSSGFKGEVVLSATIQYQKFLTSSDQFINSPQHHNPSLSHYRKKDLTVVGPGSRQIILSFIKYL